MLEPVDKSEAIAVLNQHIDLENIYENHLANVLNSTNQSQVQIVQLIVEFEAQHSDKQLSKYYCILKNGIYKWFC